MAISDTIGSMAATNPIVGSAVSSASTQSQLLTEMSAGSSPTPMVLPNPIGNGAVTSAAASQQEASQLLASLTGLGGRLNITA